MRNLLRVPPPVIALVLAALGFALDRLVPIAAALLLPILGAVLMASGFALAASALTEFRRFRTTVKPQGEPVALVEEGPYIWTRNPMYLALMTVLAGLGFFLGGLPLFLAPVAFFLVIDRVFIPYEEQKLRDLFGRSYEDYLARVRRWL
jgi:protein-S-isoprenylcysteine O-methyltransferase Ste14